MSIDAQLRVQYLAQALGYMTEEDLCALCDIELSTAKAWRDRHKGPAYSLAGNRVLYPLAAVREFLDSRVRVLATIGGKSTL